MGDLGFGHKVYILGLCLHKLQFLLQLFPTLYLLYQFLLQLRLTLRSNHEGLLVSLKKLELSLHDIYLLILTSHLLHQLFVFSSKPF